MREDAFLRAFFKIIATGFCSRQILSKTITFYYLNAGYFFFLFQA